MDENKYKNIDEDIYNAYTGAPQLAKDYIDSGKFEEFIEYLRKRMVLSPEDTQKVSNEALLALLGITDPMNLEQNLVDGQLMDRAVAKPIAEEAARAVFNDLHEKSLVQKPAAPVVAPRPPAPIAPPPPINRLAPTVPVVPPVAPSPLPVKTEPTLPTISIPKPVVPVVPVIAPKPSTPVAPQMPSAPVIPPSPAMVVPPVPPAPAVKPIVPAVPPIVAPAPSVVVDKKRPGEASTPRPSTPPASSKADPYREPIE